MDICVRNLSFVHHVSALSPMENKMDSNDKGRCRAGLQVDSSEEEVICPKPRRMALSCCAPEFIKPVCQWQGLSRMADCDAGYEILEIFLNKSACGDEEFLNFECSAPYCSPPTRASNPVIHDVQFCNQKSSSSVAFMEPKTVNAQSFAANPSVRIEGFECPHREPCLDVQASA